MEIFTQCKYYYRHLLTSRHTTEQTQIFVNNSWQLWETSIWEHLRIFSFRICSEWNHFWNIYFICRFMQISHLFTTRKFSFYWLLFMFYCCSCRMLVAVVNSGLQQVAYLLQRLDNNSQLMTNWQPLSGHWSLHTWRSFIWMEKAFWPLQWTSACWQLVY